MVMSLDRALGNNVLETLVTSNITLDDNQAPPGKLVRVHTPGATRVTITVPSDRQIGWKRTIIVTNGSASLNIPGYTLLVNNEIFNIGTDTPVIQNQSRITLVLTGATQLEAF